MTIWHTKDAASLAYVNQTNLLFELNSCILISCRDIFGNVRVIFGRGRGYLRISSGLNSCIIPAIFYFGNFSGRAYIIGRVRARVLIGHVRGSEFNEIQKVVSKYVI